MSQVDPLASLLTLAEGGYASAQLELGRVHEQGKWVKQNMAEALKWYTLAAEQGNHEAQYLLGCLYDEGKGVEYDFAIAEKWYNRAAKGLHLPALNSLGVLYLFGRGRKNSPNCELDFFKRAADQGDPIAQFNMGYAIDIGLQDSSRQVEAYQWYLLSALNGFPRAQFQVGNIHSEENENAMFDLDQAKYWYKRAAMQGYKGAQSELAALYYQDKNDIDGLSIAYFWAIVSKNKSTNIVEIIEQAGQQLNSTTIESIRSSARRWRSRRERRVRFENS